MISGHDRVEHLLREHAPRALGAVIRRFGDFGSAEDAVQEALVAAAVQWPRDGVPGNPGGWIYNVACRRVMDDRRSTEARRRREETAFLDATSQQPFTQPVSEAATQEDDTLILLFMCCHPALTDASAIALTLRAVGGLTTAEIASAFLVPEATMAQRISRAKQSIRASSVPFSMPPLDEQPQQLAAVMHVLYLIFNEGYTSSAGSALHRIELSTEAIRLTRELLRLRPADPEIAGLLALMILTDARRAARTGPGGELIPLDEQDRSLWDSSAIREGVALVTSAFARGSAGPYQLQAAIASLHDEAATTADTDWPQILALYGLLAHMTDNPMVSLNHAIATAMVHGPAAGLDLLALLDADPRVAQHYRLSAVRGHLLEMHGNRDAAIAHYRNAAAGTTSTPERNYLLMKAARLAAAKD